jgi:hypothetical protein
MSVYPEFIQHIHQLGIYVPEYNYQEMYNIMVYNLTYNIISTNNFIYTYAVMNQLYDYLEELLLPESELPDSDVEIETEPNLPINNINNMNVNVTINTNDLYNDIYANDTNETNNTNETNDTNENQNILLQQMLNYYNITMNPVNNPLPGEFNINNEITYTNLVYYNNT